MAKKKKHRRKPIDPLHLFINARGFSIASGLIDREGDVPALLWPKCACAAFSLELYFKCLLRVRRRYAENIHDPKLLFAELSKADQKRVTEIFDRVITEHPCYAQFVANDIKLNID